MNPMRNSVGTSMGSSVGTAEERLVRRLPLPGLLRRSLEVRMVCTATVIGLLLIALLLTFVTDRIRSEVFADQRDVILADAALRASVAQAEFDSTTAVTVDEVSATAEQQVNNAKNSISSSEGWVFSVLRNEQETSDDGRQRPGDRYPSALPHHRRDVARLFPT